MQKLDIIYDLVKKIDEKQDSQSDTLAELNKNVAINTKDLTLHKEGVIGNRKRINILEKQFEEAQVPKRTLKNVTKFVVWIGAISGAIYAIYRIVNLF